MVQIPTGKPVQDQDQEGLKLQRKLNHLRDQFQDGGNKEQKEELKKACQGFESLFLQKLWEKMRDTVPQEGFLHSKQEKMYLSMFNRELAKQWSEQGGIGLGDMLYKNLTGQLEQAGHSSGSTQVNNINKTTGPAPQFDSENLSGSASQNKDSLSSLAEQEVMHKVDTLAREIENKFRDDPEKNFQPIEKSDPDRAFAIENGATPLPELNWPVQGEVSSEFGWRDDPITGEKAWHSGIDVAASKGSPIKACWPGKVVYSGEKEGYGKLVVVEHAGGWQSYYGHNNRNLVQEGQTIRPGQHIADVGDTGRSTGPHLHFELRQGNLAWNPRQIERRILAGLEIGRHA